DSGVGYEVIAGDRMDCLQRSHVDNHAAADLRLAKRQVTLSARRDPKPVAAGGPYHPADVLDGRPPSYVPPVFCGYFFRVLFVDNLSVVLSVFRPSRFIQIQCSIERRQLFETRPRRPLGLRNPGTGNGVESDHQRTTNQRLRKIPARELTLRKSVFHTVYLR